MSKKIAYIIHPFRDDKENNEKNMKFIAAVAVRSGTVPIATALYFPHFLNEPKARMALDGEGEYKAGEWCRFCKARFQCRARAEEYLHLAQMEFSQPALLSDEEIAEVLSKADALKKWAEEIYTYAQNEAITNRKEWPGFKLVLGRSNRKYTDEEEVAEAAKTAGYTDIYRTSLISITEMEKLMGKKKFNEILGSYVYKPDGKVTLVPDSDKREAIYISTAEADFSQED